MALPNYKGTTQIRNTLSYRGLDEQIKRLEGFDQVFLDEMGEAMETAVGIAEAQAKANAPKLTGALAGKIYGRMLNPVRGRVMAVRGAFGVDDGLKGFAQEVGRLYGSAALGTTHYWKGKFYLYYGARDKKTQIENEYKNANTRIIQRLVVKP